VLLPLMKLVSIFVMSLSMAVFQWFEMGCLDP